MKRLVIGISIIIAVVLSYFLIMFSINSLNDRISSSASKTQINGISIINLKPNNIVKKIMSFKDKINTTSTTTVVTNPTLDEIVTTTLPTTNVVITNTTTNTTKSNKVTTKTNTTTTKRKTVAPTTTTKKRDDVFLIDMADESLTSGYLDTLSGAPTENKRRVYSTNYYYVTLDRYDVIITQNYILTVYEYNANKEFIKATDFTFNNSYYRGSNTKYIRIGLRGANSTYEKSMSMGQWAGKLKGEITAKIKAGDFNEIAKLNKQISVSSSKKYSAHEIEVALLNDQNIGDMLWQNAISSGNYNLNADKFKFDTRKTYYISPNGNDSNSGLSMLYPKKNIDSLSGVNNINILFECGKTYNISGSFKVGSNVTIASYGAGTRPVLSYYLPFNNTFSKVDTNIYVTDLKNIKELYNGKKDKSDCNISQLVINGTVNFKRIVLDSDANYSNDLLNNRKDNWSWVVDYKNAKLYIYTTSNPNNATIKYSPPVTGLTASGASNIIIQGIEITGPGQHAINFTDTSNVLIDNCSFKYIGGAVIRTGGARYGNAIQFWNATNNVTVSNNYADWIFDTCYTIQGDGEAGGVKNNHFYNNIGSHAQWGLELWGGSPTNYVNNEFDHNILYHMCDVTAPNIKMQVSSSGHGYGEATNETYPTYRYGYSYHQVANLALWFPGADYKPNIHDNIFWGTNRFLVIGTWSSDTVNITGLKNNLFYEDYHLSYDTKAALFKFKGTKNNYFTELSSITSNTSNIQKTQKRGTYDNTNEKNKMDNLISQIIS